MNEELRTYGEMLSRVPAGLYARLLTLGPTDDEFWRDDVLMILAEFEAAGKVIVDRGLMKRIVNDAGSCDYDCIMTGEDWQTVMPWAEWMPPGDLD